MAAAAGGAARRGLLKRKPNFTLQEIEILMSEVLRYEPLLFGAAASTVNAYEKQKIWWRITNKINAAGRNQRDIGEVKNRWRGLRRRANDKITRHRHRHRPRSRPRSRSARARPRARSRLGPARRRRSRPAAGHRRGGDTARCEGGAGEGGAGGGEDGAFPRPRRQRPSAAAAPWQHPPARRGLEPPAAPPA